MKKTLRIRLFAIAALAAFSFGISSAQIRVTEVMSQSGTGGTEDWFELTNLGTTDVDITGWKMDDDSFDYSLAVALNGITTIGAGESVIFLEVSSIDTASDEIAAFKTFWWGSSANDTQIGYYTGKGVSFGKGGDGVIIFDGSDNEITRVSFGATTTGSSFYWTYNASLGVVDNGLVSATLLGGVLVGLHNLVGLVATQITLSSTNILPLNVGSPGTAFIDDLLSSNPTNATDNINSWKLIGKTLLLERVPAQAIEIYSLTGSRVAAHDPASSIDLDLNQGIYIVKIDGKAHKIIIR